METLEACKRPVLENGLILGKAGRGKVFFGIDPYYMEEDKAIEHIKKYFGMEDEK